MPSARHEHRRAIDFALNERAAEEIAKGFKNEKIEKVYEARVYGKVPSDAVYRDYLLKNAKEGKVRIFQEKHAGAVPVEASVRVIGYDKNSTLVEVVIHNGKPIKSARNLPRTDTLFLATASTVVTI